MSRVLDTQNGDPLAVVAEIRIRLRANGALSIEGPIEDPVWCLAALDNARDVLKRRAASMGRSSLVVPEQDVSLPESKVVA